MEWDAVELARRLVRTESTNPGTGEAGTADLIESELKRVLPSCSMLQRVEVSKGRPVIMAQLPGRSAQELVFICHMDTVPLGDGWTKDPLGAEMENGRIYGRGACDMKSGLAAALSVFCETAQHFRESGERPAKTLKFIATMDEEGDMAGAQEVIRLGWVNAASLVADTEPTDGQIQTAHKGRYWYSYTISGRAAHASRPQDGADAVAGMARAICSAGKSISELTPDPFLGQSTIVFGQISGGIHPYQVPAKCTVSVDIRLVPPYSADDLVRILEKAAADASREMDREFGCTIECRGARPWIAHEEKAEILRLLREAVYSAVGEYPAVGPFPGYTDTAVIAGTLGNINCISYGPGSLEQAHRPDEYVRVDDIRRCRDVYGCLVKKWT